MESFSDYFHPNFDTLKLAKQVCKIKNEENKKGGCNEEWILGPVRFYTGVPRADKNFMWHTFWTKKLNLMKRQGIITITRDLHYLGDDDRNGREKGIDL